VYTWDVCLRDSGHGNVPFSAIEGIISDFIFSCIDRVMKEAISRNKPSNIEDSKTMPQR